MRWVALQTPIRRMPWWTVKKTVTITARGKPSRGPNVGSIAVIPRD
jgi:hypothetical protein